MNDLYGVDPATPSNLRDLSDLMKIFGPSEGRFIADFPMQWSSELHKHMHKVSDVGQLAMVEAWLRLSKYAVLPVKTIYKNNQSWQENAFALKDEVLKIIGPSGRPSNIIQPLDKLLTDPEAFPDARSGHIVRTSASYVNAIKPILFCSPKIVLVDPYFALQFLDKHTRTWRTDRRSKFIGLLLQTAALSRKVECFEIFTDPTKSDEATTSLKELKKIAENSGAGGMHLQVRLLDKRHPLDRHARYILGMESGLHFDHGFDIFDDGSTNHVEWISKSALTPLLDRFT
jgi:hypothetical protein